MRDKLHSNNFSSNKSFFSLFDPKINARFCDKRFEIWEGGKVWWIFYDKKIVCGIKILSNFKTPQQLKCLLTLVLVNVDWVRDCCKFRPNRSSSVPWCATHVQLNWRIAQPWTPSMRTLRRRKWSKFERLMRRRRHPTVNGNY